MQAKEASVLTISYKTAKILQKIQRASKRGNSGILLGIYPEEREVIYDLLHAGYRVQRVHPYSDYTYKVSWEEKL